MEDIKPRERAVRLLFLAFGGGQACARRPTEEGSVAALPAAPSGGDAAGGAAGERHTSETLVDEDGGVVAEGVAVVGIEAGRKTASALIAEEVGEGVEGAVVLALLLEGLELLLDALDEELLGLDLGDLDVAVGITVEGELGAEGGGEVLEELAHLGGELLLQMRGGTGDIQRSGSRGQSRWRGCR